MFSKILDWDEWEEFLDTFTNNSLLPKIYIYRDFNI